MNSGADFPGTGKPGLLQPPSGDGLAVLVSVREEPEERLAGAAPSLIVHVITAATDAPVTVSTGIPSTGETLLGLTGSTVQEKTLLLQGTLHGREGRLPQKVKI